jgi:hypothetical protein
MSSAVSSETGFTAPTKLNETFLYERNYKHGKCDTMIYLINLKASVLVEIIHINGAPNCIIRN